MNQLIHSLTLLGNCSLLMVLFLGAPSSAELPSRAGHSASRDVEFRKLGRPEACPERSRRIPEVPFVPSEPANLFGPQALPKSTNANELGRIPVVMYHAFGAPAYRGARYDRNGLNIAPETFRKHLQLMYDSGWYPVNMRDVLTPRIAVPAGKIPVVLTFDDARATQFIYMKDGNLDPDCGVAIMQQFHKQHPDWPLKGSFYLLPESRYNPVPFGQKGQENRKLKALQDMGFELANHSTTHRMMARLSAKDLAFEMATCAKYFKDRVPSATMDTMALPGGSVPKQLSNMDVLLDGVSEGYHYHNLCILRAWGGPTLPPTNKKFDIKDILRIGTEPGSVEGWVKHLRPGGELEPFISDGQPDVVTVPLRLAPFLATDRLRGLRVVTYDDGRGHNGKANVEKPDGKSIKPAKRHSRTIKP